MYKKKRRNNFCATRENGKMEKLLLTSAEYSTAKQIYYTISLY